MHQSPSSQPARTPDGWPNCGQWSLQEAALQPSVVIKATMITMVTKRSGIIRRAKSSIRGGGRQEDNMCYLQCRRDSSELDDGHKHAYILTCVPCKNPHTCAHTHTYCTHPQPPRPKTAQKPDNECEMVKSLIL